uniref:Fibrinogen C-terminal domain-containing protein n=2 Tax=Ciona savignyi TaxID=51511 RepID=H2Y4B0_CIOSA
MYLQFFQPKLQFHFQIDIMLKYILLILLSSSALGLPSSQCSAKVDLLEQRIAELERRPISCETYACGIEGLSQEVQVSQELQESQELQVSQESQESQELRPTSCQDYFLLGLETDGIYKIFVGGEWVKVYCNLSGGNNAWLVIQRRQDGEVDFYRNWSAYKNGFGNKSADFWLGLHNLHLLTRDGNYELKIVMRDCQDVEKHATYSTFRVAGASDLYKLEIGGYSGTAGDALAVNNGAYFSTKDRDNDKFRLHCATHRRTAWWYKGNCGDANLNGPYLPCGYYEDAVASYYTFHDQFYGLRFIEMKIRRRSRNNQ